MSDKPFVPAGHFYSPITSSDDAIVAMQRAADARGGAPQGIEIDAEAMIALWHKIAPGIVQMPFGDEAGVGEFRYHFVNNMYSHGDAAIYFGVVKQFEPKRIIEIGSGYSSALALDMRDIFGHNIDLTFIEPYPTTLNKLLRDEDRSTTTIIEEKVQNTSVKLFEQLQQNDILFVDSSHVAKTGSDVCFVIFEILPRLRPGVLVHFHDCFWPFEYPPAWAVEQARSWNELYFLRTFLMYNQVFKVEFFNSYFALRHRSEAAKYETRFLKNPGGGLWLRRKEATKHFVAR